MSLIYNDMGSSVDDKDMEEDNNQNNSEIELQTVSQTIDREKSAYQAKLANNKNSKNDCEVTNDSQLKSGNRLYSGQTSHTQLPQSMPEGIYKKTISYAVDNGLNDNPDHIFQVKGTCKHIQK